MWNGGGGKRGIWIFHYETYHISHGTQIKQTALQVFLWILHFILIYSVDGRNSVAKQEDFFHQTWTVASKTEE